MSPRRIPSATRHKGPSHLKRVLVACILLLAAVPVLAQSAATYELSWWTVDGGGGTSSDGVYSLTGTAAQPEAGLVSGGTFTLAGGFWPSGAAAAPQRAIYLPLVVRNH